MHRVRYAVLIAAALLFVPWALAQRGAGEAQQANPPAAQPAPGQTEPGPAQPPPDQEPPPGQAEPAPDLNVVGERELQGTVVEVQDAQIEGTPLVYKVALLETEQGMVVADLGPAEDLANVEIGEGTSLAMQGTLVEVEGRPFFVAKELRVDERQIQIQRQLPDGLEQPEEQPEEQPQPQP